MTYLEIEILRKLAQSWNNLDTKYILDNLSDNIIYESQWVLVPINGKREFIAYLESKFNAIKSAMKHELIQVTAELALAPSLQNKPCIILTQITNQGIRQVSILIEITNSKIERIDICFIPSPDEAELTGEIPK